MSDMYALGQSGIHIRQTLHARVTTIVYVTKPSIYAQQYFCNKTHLTMGKKMQTPEKFAQVFITLHGR